MTHTGHFNMQLLIHNYIILQIRIQKEYAQSVTDVVNQNKSVTI